MHHHRSRAASAALAGAILFAAAAPMAAVVGSQPDTTNRFPHVGSVQWQVEPGLWFGVCSGTLIASDLVVTAAHCVAGSATDTIPTADVRVSLNPVISAPADQADPFAYSVAEVIVHPTLAPAMSAGNSKNALDQAWDDIALLRLTADVIGIAPAAVGGAGYLDALSLRSETFTAVGYGIEGFVTGSAASPVGSVVQDFSRSFADVRALGHDVFPDRYLKISAANCFGDSGGGLFHDGTLVAITIWTNSARCEGPGLDYRLDTPIALELLADNL
ncbi:MAG: trypsin-like serine protease [Candidatus Limnocylindria bacterium]